MAAAMGHPAAAVVTAALVAAALVGCEQAADVEVCHFASGRPCRADEVCLGAKGDECNYYVCQDGALIGGAVACSAGEVPAAPGGPFTCDPSAIERAPGTGGFVPPPAPCPLGGLWTIDPARGVPYGACVPVAQCAPLPCDPAFAGDGCPADHVCDAATSTCVPRQ